MDDEIRFVFSGLQAHQEVEKRRRLPVEIRRWIWINVWGDPAILVSESLLNLSSTGLRIAEDWRIHFPWTVSGSDPYRLAVSRAPENSHP
jgi:hypothetical protein